MVVHQLLQKGANVNARDHYGHTPLMRAIRYGHVDVVRILMAHGADHVGVARAHCLPSRAKQVKQARELVAKEIIRCTIIRGKRHLAAITIQCAWRHCISDPSMSMCKRRLRREFDEL
jgi:hypothetical protein